MNLKKRHLLHLLLLPALALVLLVPRAGLAQYGNEGDAYISESGSVYYAKHTAIYKELVKLQTTLPEEQFLRHVSARVTTLKTEPDIAAVIAFLWQNSYDKKPVEKLNTNYFLLLSDAYVEYIPHVRHKDDLAEVYRKALKSLSVFELLSMADGSRCADSSGWSIFKKQLLVPRIKALKQAYTTLPPKEFKLLLQTAILFEETVLGRPANTDICNLGTKPKGKDMFVDTYTWYSKRQQVHTAIKKFWFERYKGITGIDLDALDRPINQKDE